MVGGGGGGLPQRALATSTAHTGQPPPDPAPPPAPPPPGFKPGSKFRLLRCPLPARSLPGARASIEAAAGAGTCPANITSLRVYPGSRGPGRAGASEHAGSGPESVTVTVTARRRGRAVTGTILPLNFNGNAARGPAAVAAAVCTVGDAHSAAEKQPDSDCPGAGSWGRGWFKWPNFQVQDQSSESVRVRLFNSLIGLRATPRGPRRPGPAAGPALWQAASCSGRANATVTSYPSEAADATVVLVLPVALAAPD